MKLSFTLSIIVPIKNEENILKPNLESLARRLNELPKHLSSQIEVILSDCGSVDESIAKAQPFCKQDNWRIISEHIEESSIGKTVNLGLEICLGEFVLILPADCILSENALPIFFEKIEKEEVFWSGFRKKYSPTSYLMDIYALFINRLRSQGLRKLVWTNGFIVKRKLLKKIPIPTHGFMEDVELSKKLFKKYKLTFLPANIVVSSRRYLKNPLRQIVLNGLVLALYNLGFRDRRKLKKLYELFS